jgi:hypothetical protein
MTVVNSILLNKRLNSAIILALILSPHSIEAMSAQGGVMKSSAKTAISHKMDAPPTAQKPFPYI